MGLNREELDKYITDVEVNESTNDDCTVRSYVPSNTPRQFEMKVSLARIEEYLGIEDCKDLMRVLPGKKFGYELEFDFVYHDTDISDDPTDAYANFTVYMQCKLYDGDDLYSQFDLREWGVWCKCVSFGETLSSYRVDEIIHDFLTGQMEVIG